MKFKSRANSLLILAFLLAIISIPDVYGLSVVSTMPAQNALNVLINSPITITFDEILDSATISDQTFVVNGSLSGLNSGTFSFDSALMSATLALSEPFAKGERVTVVLTNSITNSSSVPLGTSFVLSFTTSVSSGNGSFALDSTYGVDPLPHSIFAGDIDNDGDIDLATSNFQPGGVSVLLNDGSGVFGPQTVYPVGTDVRYVFGADFDRDGYLDLATGNGGTDNISVLINNGNGTFVSQVPYAAGDGPHSIYCADLNGDGFIDIACGNAFGNTISVHLNNGDGTFAAASQYVTATHPRAVFAADLDNDGDLDLATANLYSGSTSVLLNNGNGTFAPKADYPLGSSPRLVYSADLNADGFMDLVSANSSGGDIAVLLNEGDGTFTAPVSNNVLAPDPYAVNASDFSNNGILNLITANTNGNNLSYFTNDGNANLALSGQFGSGGSGPLSLGVADFNNDGALDIATSNFFEGSVSILFNNAAVVSANKLVIPSGTLFPCQRTCQDVQSIQTNLNQPINGATIPIEVPAGFVICSVSTQGLITEDWDITYFDVEDWDDSGFIFVLLANSFGELVPAGLTTVFNIYFGAEALCLASHFVHWDTALSADPSRQLLFSDTLSNVIFPEFDPLADSLEIEGYIPGDFNTDGSVDILDLTAFVDRIFRGGAPACQLNTADINGDCLGPNIGDLTYLVNYIFRGGALPKCGCI